MFVCKVELLCLLVEIEPRACVCKSLPLICIPNLRYLPILRWVFIIFPRLPSSLKYWNYRYAVSIALEG